MSITVLNKTAIAVKLPEHATNISLAFRGRKLSWDIKYDPDDTDWTIIPPGQWSILGMSDVLTEVQWMDVVDQKFVAESFGHGMVFFDYKRSEEKQMKCWTCATAIESGQTLLKSKGITTPQLILINQQSLTNKEEV